MSIGILCTNVSYWLERNWILNCLLNTHPSTRLTERSHGRRQKGEPTKMYIYGMYLDVAWSEFSSTFWSSKSGLQPPTPTLENEPGNLKERK